MRVAPDLRSGSEVWRASPCFNLRSSSTFMLYTTSMFNSYSYLSTQVRGLSFRKLKEPILKMGHEQTAKSCDGQSEIKVSRRNNQSSQILLR